MTRNKGILGNCWLSKSSDCWQLLAKVPREKESENRCTEEPRMANVKQSQVSLLEPICLITTSEDVVLRASNEALSKYVPRSKVN